jgi:peptidoglycan/xylan/chitin deacetylase (PgdA/CDA1 family)
MRRRLLLCELAGKVIALVWLTANPASRLALVVLVAPDLYVLYHLFVPSAQGACRVLTRFETKESEVWLTIDDGPDAEDTPRILDLLDEHGARATFFLVGKRADALRHVTAEIRRRGHEIAHHTHTHPAASFWCAFPRRVRRELDLAQSVFDQVGAKPTRFRAPVGIKSVFLAEALAQRGMRCVGWTIRSFDAGSNDPKSVVARVMAQVKPGAIILMHEGRTVAPKVRVHAIAGLLDALREKRITCVIPGEEQLR